MTDKIFWTNKDIDFLINHYIREYDMSKAGPTALFMGGCIDKKQYDFLCSLNRMDRQIKTGLLIKSNPEFDKIKQQILTQIRLDFQASNNLEDNDILSIKNDAIFVIDKICSNTQFGDMVFKTKNVYSSYYRFRTIEIYYYGDATNETMNKIDVKGIGDDHLAMHQDFLIDFMHYLFSSAQDHVARCVPALQQFEADYLNYDLPLGFYREFNSSSMFRLNIPDAEYTSYMASHLPEDTDRRLIDLNYNLNLIRHLYKIYAGLLLQ